jgi:hypothetical protein
VLMGLAFRMSRVGHPGNVRVRLGSREGGDEIGKARISAESVGRGCDLWYEAKVNPTRLESASTYFFEITAESGLAPQDFYLIYGPRPLGGSDFPPFFGLSYRVVTQREPFVQSGCDQTKLGQGSSRPGRAQCGGDETLKLAVIGSET